MSGEDPKAVILARRRRFLAAAIASVGISCGPGTPQPSPQPCLSQPMPRPPEADGGTKLP